MPPTPQPLRVRRYGWRPSLPDQRDVTFTAPAPVDVHDLPVTVDLREQMPAVWDQGNLGSCTSFATGAAFQYEVTKQGHAAYYPSFLAQYWWSRYLDGPENTPADTGATIRSAVKAAARFGVAHDSAWPYEPRKFARQPNKKTTTDAEKHQVLRYVAVPQDVTQMRACLAGGWPIVVGISVYESFEGADVAQSGRVPMPRPNERLLGGHAVLVVGYDWTSAGYEPSGYDPRFLCRNSWSTSWGDKGYFTLPAQYLNDPDLSGDYWSVRLVEQ